MSRRTAQAVFEQFLKAAGIDVKACKDTSYVTGFTDYTLEKGCHQDHYDGALWFVFHRDGSLIEFGGEGTGKM